jgi:HlyD family secretion protein
MNRNLLLGIIAAVVVVGVGAYLVITHHAAKTEWQGYAEADYVKVGPTQPGMLTGVHVHRGDRIAAGAPLFDQDDAADRAAVDQARRQLDQAGRQVANLQAPGRQTEIVQSEANLADATANRDRLQADLKRYETLASVGAVTTQSRDQTRADLASAVAKVHAMQAALDQMRAATGRPEEIAAQMAGAEGARAALAAAQWRLSQRHFTAPAGGVVDDVMARPGETLQAGAPVVSLLPPGNIFIRFFVNETMLGRLHPGDRVTFACDGCAANLAGTIEFVSPSAEYTPPLIYSDQNRAKLTYMVQARPRSDQALLFNPGQPVTVQPAFAAAR